MRYMTMMAALLAMPVSVQAGILAPRSTPEPIDIGVEPTFEQIKLEVEARTADLLVDPESARFKYPYMTVEQRGSKHPNGWATCAMVNARNSMGGYTGYQIVLIRFVQGKVVFFNIVDDSIAERQFLCGDMPSRAQAPIQNSVVQSASGGERQ